MLINKNKKGFTPHHCAESHNGAGFTLIEVLLIVAIFAIILSSAISLTTTQIFESDLEAKSLEVASMIEKAQNHSVTGYRGDVWSIKVLDNDALCNDNGDCILLFKGRDFSGRDTSYDRFVQFDQSISGVYINADQANEFYFDYKSGWLATSTASYLEQQHIVLSSNIGNQKSIVIQPSGVSSIFVCGEDKVFDINGNDYITVKIGTECWMAENLNTGTRLATASNDPTDNSIVEKWCESDLSTNCDTQGGLYNWDEAMAYVETSGAQGICPNGWHIPTDAELDILVANYPSASVGTELKLQGSSGFNFRETNRLNSDTNTYDMSNLLAMWTSTISSGNAYAHYTYTASADMSVTTVLQSYGEAVRCLKDY
jgi:uncharacterized protein (TIGR02145 family)